MLDAQTIDALQSFPLLGGLEDFEFEIPPARPGRSSRDRATEYIDRLKENIQAGSRLLAESTHNDVSKFKELTQLIDRLHGSDRGNALVILEKSIANLENKNKILFKNARTIEKLREITLKKVVKMFGREFESIFRSMFSEQARLARLLCEQMTESLAVYRAFAAKLDDDAQGGKAFSDPGELERYLKHL